MDAVTIVLFLLGLALLVAGAEALVRGASRMAEALGISPLIVGLTVVAFGTSSPELAVSVASAWQGNGDLALGNVVGSNLFNLLFILGASALVLPLVAARAVIRIEAPVMIATAALVWLMGANGLLSRGEGLLLVLGLTGFLGWQIREARRGALPVPVPRPAHTMSEHLVQVAAEAAAQAAHDKAWRRKRLAVDLLLMIGGLAGLALGSHWLVTGAVALARTLGVSDLVIAVTIVAAGTGLPEVATSVMASLRKQPDIAIGNVIGSNILNILGVLGFSAIVAPGGIVVAPSALRLDVPLMVAVSLLTWGFLATGKRVSRWEGAVLLAGYIVYVATVLATAATV